MVVDSDGVPRVAARLYFYLPATTTDITTYTTPAYAVEHENPVESVSNGFFPAVYINPAVNPTYKLVVKDAAGVTIWTEDNVPALGFGQSDIGAVFYPISEIEDNAGLDATDLDTAYEYGDALRYKMVGDWNGSTGTDNATAFRNLMAAAQEGLPSINLRNGRYRIIVSGTDADFSAFDSQSGFTIYSDGAELYFDASFSGTQTVEVFSFRDCDSMSLIGSIKGTQFPVAGFSSNNYNGIDLFKFYDGCTNVRTGPIYANGIGAVVTWRRAAVDPKGSGAIHELIDTVDCIYPLACTLNPDNLTANVVSLRSVRSYYPYGISNHTINVNSQDHRGDADANMSSASGEGCQGVDLTYTNLNSTVADASIDCVRISFTDQTPAIHRNIRINLNISAATASDFLGYAFVVEKLTNAGASDTVDRGHILSNIELTGAVNAKNGSHRTIGWEGTWGAGEFVRNFVARNLRLDGGGQPSFNLASLKDKALLEDVYSSSQINLTGNTTGKITCINVESVGSLTSATADTSKVTYIACKFGDLTNQSITNKKFYDCDGMGTSYTGTLVGCTTSPTASVNYSINGDVLTLEVPALTGTSNTNACTITGAPVQIRPTANKLIIGRYTDNGSDAIGLIRLETDGTLRLFNAAGSSTFFTTSGTKGTPAFVAHFRMS